LFTFEAFPPATDDISFFGHPRIDDLVFDAPAEGTLHDCL
jgi:hypothetical protein